VRIYQFPDVEISITEPFPPTSNSNASKVATRISLERIWGETYKMFPDISRKNRSVYQYEYGYPYETLQAITMWKKSSNYLVSPVQRILIHEAQRGLEYNIG
jgi:hypothetical protein